MALLTRLPGPAPISRRPAPSSTSACDKPCAFMFSAFVFCVPRLSRSRKIACRGHLPSATAEQIISARRRTFALLVKPHLHHGRALSGSFYKLSRSGIQLAGRFLEAKKIGQRPGGNRKSAPRKTSGMAARVLATRYTRYTRPPISTLPSPSTWPPAWWRSFAHRPTTSTLRAPSPRGASGILLSWAARSAQMAMSMVPSPGSVCHPASVASQRAGPRSVGVSHLSRTCGARGWDPVASRPTRGARRSGS
jgi:hypothetical protein